MDRYHLIGIIGNDSNKIANIIAEHLREIKYTIPIIAVGNSFSELDLVTTNDGKKILLIDAKSSDHVINRLNLLNEQIKQDMLFTYDRIEYDEYLEENKPTNDGARRMVHSRNTGDNYFRMRAKKRNKNRKKRRNK